MKIILGSQSSGRKQVLLDAGYDFEILSSNIDEKAIRSDDYHLLPLLIAREKAKALLNKINEPAILITSDQVVVCNKELREKPENKDQARAYLESYNDFPAQTNTAVVVTNTQTGKQAEAVDVAKVYFKNIPENVIEELLKNEKLMSAAGGFLADHPSLVPYILKFEGDMTSILGLPLKLTERLMSQVQ